MKTTINIDIQEFPVPTTVYEQIQPIPARSAPSVHPVVMADTDYRPHLEYLLSELSIETLDELCEKFRIDVFNKAGKAMPPHAVERQAQ